MFEVRNAEGKLVCRIDPPNLTVEIVMKGQKTVVVFVSDSNPIVINSKAI
ncbi:MAG: hypothetical protein FWG24_06665 [Eggerthellaceae bacterium]|nr:hypothetical protein [Eggerthellaceae bacterium]